MVQICPLFVNVHTIENVNSGGQKTTKSYQRWEQPVRPMTGEWFIDLLSLDLKQDFEYKTAGLASFNNKIHSSNQKCILRALL